MAVIVENGGGSSGSGGGGGNTMIGFILGAVLIAVAIVGFFMWDGFKSHGGQASAPISVTVHK